MAKKDQLLAELIGKDSTGYVQSVHAGLVSSGLTFHDSGKTLLYKKGAQLRSAIRVVNVGSENQSVFSFPKNYWNNHEKTLANMMSKVSTEFHIPTGGRYGQQSAGQIEICDQTIGVIRSILIPIVSTATQTKIAEEPQDIASPLRQTVETNRILRDTAITKKVKSIHNYQCQICGTSIELKDGAKYAEGHHIKPLGEPHNGPDIEENVLCVCPNHHVQLDYGAIMLSTIRDRELSPIRDEFIEYHNNTLYRLNIT